MKFSLSWLKNYLEFESDLESLCNKLTMIGLEVEEVFDEAKALEKFEVAYIEEAKKHENSNKLNICKVKDGSGQIHQVVCGAKNARAGIKVALAKIGAIVPSNKMVIKKAKLAGVESLGMLCSRSEIGVEGDDSGIVEIDEKYDLGTKISNVFGKNDAIIDVNITPNRGDCLGVYGIARDLAASGFGKLKKLDIKSVKADFESQNIVEIDDFKGCGLFLSREIKNVKNQESPKWLKDKLESIGQNSISALVDITNYVMFCLNRPMHAYDLEKINGKIEVRKAKDKEKFLSLKDLEYNLSEDIMVISDEQEVIAVAGVMGSKNSGCDENTKNILLEAAYFDKSCVLKSGRQLNILSEARYRFERGVDYKTCIEGIELATKLIKEVCGGEIGDVKTTISEKFNQDPKKIKLNINKVEKLVGIKIDKDEILRILSNLGFLCQEGEQILVEVPTYRSDIEGEADLIEEIVRIYGYNNIKSEIIDYEFKKPFSGLLDRIREKLVASSMIENINWSFCNSELAIQFGKVNDSLFIFNPISENLNYMRPNLIIGLLNSYKNNYLRSNFDGSSFEIGKIFLGTQVNEQKNMISGIRAGKNKDQSHYEDSRNFDLFDVKKDAFGIIDFFGVKEKSIQIDDNSAPKYYHPHRSASLKLGKNIIGYFGEIHPKILKNYELKTKICAFEIFIDNLPQKAFDEVSLVKKPYSVSDFQPVYRDFAFLLDKNKKIADLSKIIESVDKNIISKVNIFDIYEGDNIESGKKSVALRVEIQPFEKNMTSSEVDDISQKII